MWVHTTDNLACLNCVLNVLTYMWVHTIIHLAHLNFVLNVLTYTRVQRIVHLAFFNFFLNVTTFTWVHTTVKLTCLNFVLNVSTYKGNIDSNLPGMFKFCPKCLDLDASTYNSSCDMFKFGQNVSTYTRIHTR